jgi:hypothetical protein
MELTELACVQGGIPLVFKLALNIKHFPKMFEACGAMSGGDDGWGPKLNA